MPTPTPEQLAIITDTDHHLLVEAGPGSGKTWTLIEKALFEQGLSDIRPSPAHPIGLDSIGIVTFTRKAAAELNDRLRRALLIKAHTSQGRDRERWAQEASRLDQALIGTIDAFAGHIVRNYGGLMGMETNFQVLDEADASKLYVEIAEEALMAGLDAGTPGAVRLAGQYGYNKARETLSQSLARGDILESLAQGPFDWSTLNIPLTIADSSLAPVAEVVRAFLVDSHQKLKARFQADGVLDHAHILVAATKLSADAGVQEAVRRRFRLLFVDEYQDTSRLQALLVGRLAGLVDAHGEVTDQVSSRPRMRLIAVGDPKQGIYGFRDADITRWSETRSWVEAANGRIYTLATTQRGRPALVRVLDATLGPILTAPVAPQAAAQQVPVTAMAAARMDTPGHAVHLVIPEDDSTRATATAVARQVRTMLDTPDWLVWETRSDGSEIARPVRAEDIVVLVRSVASASGAYRTAFSAVGLDLAITGSRALYTRPEIRDAVACLQCVTDPSNVMALTTVLRSPFVGLDDTTLALLAPSGLSLSSLEASCQLLEDALARTTLRAGLDLIQMLRTLRDRLTAAELIKVAFEDSGYRAILAGAPDAPAGLRNLDKLMSVLARDGQMSLPSLVQSLAHRVRESDREDEAPLSAANDGRVTLSTMHGAKGLEWPVVIIAGLTDAAVRRADPETLVIDEDAGVILGLPIVQRDVAGNLKPMAETSGVWRWHAERTWHRQMAEARRLFYVSCTRARDHLLLVTAVRKGLPEPIVQGPDDGGIQGAERWLRGIWQIDGKTLPALISVGQDFVPVLHPAPVASEKTTSSWAQLPETGAVNAPWPEATATALGSMTHRSMMRVDVGVSEVMKYMRCSLQHLYGYRQSISTPELLAQTGDEAVNRITPDVRADILQHFLARHSADWSEQTSHEEMRQSILSVLPLAEADLDSNARILLTQARHYITSAWASRIAQARQSYREAPFVHIIENVRLRGVYSNLFEEADGWRILAVKTSLFREFDDPREAARNQATHYEAEAAMLTLAAEAALGQPIREFVFYFTDADEAVVRTVTPEWLAEWKTRIEEVLPQMRAGKYENNPVYKEDLCKRCAYRKICRPQGDPDLVSLARAPEKISAS